MNISSEQRKKLRDALIDAFTAKSLLEQLLSLELDKNLDEIAGGISLQEIVFNLIKAAEAQGWIEDLVRAALRSNPKNFPLKDIAEELKIIVSPKSASQLGTRVEREPVRQSRTSSQHTKNLLISSMGAIIISTFCVVWLSQHLADNRNPTPPRTVSITPSLSPSVEKLTQDLQAVNISFSDPDLRNQLNNPYSKYPQFANACLKLLEDRRLKQELSFDVIFWNYTHELGGKLNRDSPDGNLDTGILKKAMVTAHNAGYGNKTSSFEDIVEPKQ